MSLGMLAILLFAFTFRLDSESASAKHRKIFVLLGTYINVVGSALVSTADQFIHGEITVLFFVP
jgi:hypothetical protein